jgi:hypothetical protein
MQTGLTTRMADVFDGSGGFFPLARYTETEYFTNENSTNWSVTFVDMFV